MALKALWLVQAEEPRDSHSYYFFRDQLWLLRALPGMAILLPMAVLGFITSLRQHERTALLLSFGTAAAATSVFLVVGTRYRMPLVPVLAVAAGAGLDALASDIVARRAGA